MPDRGNSKNDEIVDIGFYDDRSIKFLIDRTTLIDPIKPLIGGTRRLIGRILA
jgi:hypothetical protein